MFRTQMNHELKIPMPRELFGQDSNVQHWRAFEIVLHNFWFIVEFMVNDDGYKHWNTICASDLTDALSLAAAEFILEHRINLVIPVHQNKERQMQMKPIVEIYAAEEDGQKSMTIYVTSDGSRYVDTALCFKESQAKNKSTLYVKKNIDVRPATEDEED